MVDNGALCSYELACDDSTDTRRTPGLERSDRGEGIIAFQNPGGMGEALPLMPVGRLSGFAGNDEELPRILKDSGKWHLIFQSKRIFLVRAFMNQYDVIGDIHGHAVELKTLLEKLGYRRNEAGTYMPPEACRTAIFTGDYIDRGGENFEVIRIVRDMVEAGHAHAVMGNHEMNAVLFHTLHPHPESGEAKPLRKHDSNNTHQHQTFLDELALDHELGEKNIQWLKSLPVCLERDGLRFVHAMWDQAALDYLRGEGLFDADDSIHPDRWHELAVRGTPGCDAIDMLTKGQMVELPAGMWYADSEGTLRRKARLKWWGGAGDAGLMFHQAVLEVPAEAMPDVPAPEEIKNRMRELQENEGAVVFFGHYWMTGELPAVENERAICLDQSVAKDGHLAAATITVEDGKVLEMVFSSVKARATVR